MKLLTCVLFLLSCCIGYAQIKISGQVIGTDNLPVTYVNVYIKNTTIGTVTDLDGNFEFTSKKNRGRLIISLMGYETISLKFNAKKKYFKIILKEESNTLDEVVIVSKPKKRLSKKENPAYRILKEIWKRKKENGLKLTKTYQYKKHLTTEIGLNNLDTAFIKNIFKKDYKKIINQLAIGEDKKGYYIPLYLSESVSRVYGNNIIKQQRIDIEAEKKEGVQKNGFAFDRIARTFGDVDIYKDNFQLLKTSFISPISTSGFDTYDFVLNDSTVINGTKLYNIYFFPRRNDLAFVGNFWVADKSFSITKIKMKTNKEINLNFVRNISIEKEYFIKNDSIYLPKKEVYIGDFTLLDKSEDNKGMTVHKSATYSQYLFNKPLSNNFYSQSIIRYKPKQFEKHNVYT